MPKEIKQKQQCFWVASWNCILGLDGWGTCGCPLSGEGGGIQDLIFKDIGVAWPFLVLLEDEDVQCHWIAVAVACTLGIACDYYRRVVCTLVLNSTLFYLQCIVNKANMNTSPLLKFPTVPASHTPPRPPAARLPARQSV